MGNILGRLFSRNQSASFLKEAGHVVTLAAKKEDEITSLSKEALQERLRALKERTEGRIVSDEDMAEVFAFVRESAKRTLGERHYDVQLMGGLALARGKIAEMRTGEGKTLVATLAATARALAGKGVHIVTVNDYLARRDAAWMGQIYDYLGLTVGVVTSAGSYRYDARHVSSKDDEKRDEEGSFRIFYDYLRPATKREAYAADITYATNNELGFDYLRDNTAYDPSQLVQGRGEEGAHHYAIVDEIDSILIDEARTPLIISGPAPDSSGLYGDFARIVENFAEGEDYTVDEKQRAVQITEAGIKKAEDALGIENLYTEGSLRHAHHLETAVRAKALFHKDKEYVVKDGEITIVDEFTGRLQTGRRWSDGLHQAVEAKEGVKVKAETRTYASVTFQNYFRMYDALSGMTGTALSSEEEFFTVYGLEVVVVPTNRDIKRIDHDDHIFQTAHGKYQALTREVSRLHEKGQPVLIGTVSIEDNEVISRYFTEAGVPHEVLNAKNHEREGEIIAQAGRRGNVTVATNLAGRGVDIKLGGAPVGKETYEAVVALGGLFVIGTERHEARRIDDQLRGRSGRQGDPGETRFYVSLEDKLMRVFASDMLKQVMGTFKIREDEPIESSLITRSLETAQKRIEGFNFDARKQVLAYDDVLNTQRLAIYARRSIPLLSASEAVETAARDLAGNDDKFTTSYQAKKEELGEHFIPVLRRLMLQLIDTLWLEHIDAMEQLRRSVSLRAYGQRDPLLEYRREGLMRFRALEESLAHLFREALPHVRMSDEARIRAEEEKTRKVLLEASKESESPSGTPITKSDEPGRNDMVTIEKNGVRQTMKYKKAELLFSDGWTLLDTKS